MKYALIFAIMAGRPVVLQYGGNLSVGYDPAFAREISFGEAERRLQNGTPPILFAPPGRPVYRATNEEGRALLREWDDAKGNKRRMKAALMESAKSARNRARKAKGYTQY